MAGILGCLRKRPVPILCWVDYLLGFILCDMAVDDASLKLWPPVRDTPVLPPDEVHCFESSTAAGAGDVRFVNIEARCCGGDHGRSTCEHVRFLFTVTTWT